MPLFKNSIVQGMRMKRTVFFVSDGTGITAETVGHTLLTQFGSLDFERISIPFANTSSQIEDIVNKIKPSS